MSNNLQKIAGGTGCDIVTHRDGVFTPRKGKIYSMVVREANTNIEYIKEYNNGVTTTVTDRSWIGVPTGASSAGESDEGYKDLVLGELLIPDFPVTELVVANGSVMVYYDEYAWRHFRR